MTTYAMTIGGQAVSAGQDFEVVNPATGKAFAVAPSCDRATLDAAVTSAHGAFGEWRRDLMTRRKALHEIADRVDAHVDELARIMTLEQGKPLADSRGEILRGTSFVRYYADLEVSPLIVSDDETGYAEVHRRPFGVVAAITPWNFPIMVALWKLGPALLGGNTVVLKPSPYTPLTALRLGEILRDVLPAGVVNVVTGHEPLGADLVAHPLVRKVSFTGSTGVGRLVAAAAVPDFKRVTLELGGNDPAVVLDDVDVDAVAEGLFWGAFRNNGQICAAVKRVYVPQRIYQRLGDLIADQARAVKVGDGVDEGVQLGPLNNEPQRTRVRELTAAAVASGGRALTGGADLDRPGYFYAPTIVAGLDGSEALVVEEQFGPSLPLVPYRDLDDAIRQANDSVYGLTASVWGSDLDRAAAVAAEIDAGQVSINLHGRGVRPDLPFGGHKSSGLGVENGPWGFEQFTDLQVIAGPARTNH